MEDKNVVEDAVQVWMKEHIAAKVTYWRESMVWIRRKREWTQVRHEGMQGGSEEEA